MGSELSPREIELIDRIYATCYENAPNYGVSSEQFSDCLRSAFDKWAAADPTPPGDDAKTEFLEQIQADDLFLALACANGNERAWWEFDQSHRNFIERVARHLAKTDINAQEAVDLVYVELYGTKIVDGERVSKFATYSGRGSLRGWLRTVVWHSLVDLHRASHDEVSLDAMIETVGEGIAHANIAVPRGDVESEVIENLSRERYRQVTVAALGRAFEDLDEHEKLILLLYHVERLKLREIAKLVENEGSPLRGWFKRRASGDDEQPRGRIHESTVKRWLEKSYGRILAAFRDALANGSGLGPAEIKECMELARSDLNGGDLLEKLSAAPRDGASRDASKNG